MSVKVLGSDLHIEAFRGLGRRLEFNAVHDKLTAQQILNNFLHVLYLPFHRCYFDNYHTL